MVAARPEGTVQYLDELKAETKYYLAIPHMEKIYPTYLFVSDKGDLLIEYFMEDYPIEPSLMSLSNSNIGCRNKHNDNFVFKRYLDAFKYNLLYRDNRIEWEPERD